MRKLITKSRLLVIFSVGVATVALIVGQEPATEYIPITVTVQKIMYGPNGLPLASELGTYSYRSDGSNVYEWAITRHNTGEVGRGRVLRDLTQRLETAMMYDLGVSVSRKIPEQVVRGFHKTTRECKTLAEQAGTQEGDNPFSRRSVKPNGTVVVQRLAQDLGCQVVEFTAHAADGRLLESQNILRSLESTDDSLFSVDTSLEAVTWPILADRHEKKYGRKVNNRTIQDFNTHEERYPSVLDTK